MEKPLPSGDSAHSHKRRDKATDAVLLGFLAFVLLALGAFSGTYLSTSLLYVLPVIILVMVTLGMVAPARRRRKGTQTKQETKQDNRLIYWTARFCVTFVIGSALMGMNVPLFAGNILGFVFQVNSANIGYTLAVASFVLFMEYYLRVYRRVS